MRPKTETVPQARLILACLNRMPIAGTITSPSNASTVVATVLFLRAIMRRCGTTLLLYTPIMEQLFMSMANSVRSTTTLIRVWNQSLPATTVLQTAFSILAVLTGEMASTTVAILMTLPFLIALFLRMKFLLSTILFRKKAILF